MDTLPEALHSCPVCASGLAPDEAIQACPRCETPHHQECWDYVGACAIFGCSAQATPPAASVGSPVTDLVEAGASGATGLLLSTFTWVMRLHWWAFAAMNLGLALMVPAALWLPFGGILLPFLPFVCLFGVFSYLLLSLPLVVLQAVLQARLSFSATAPKKNLRAVLDRIDFAPAESLAKRLSDGVPGFYRWASGLGCIWSSGLMLSQVTLDDAFATFFLAFVYILFGYLPIAFLRQGTHARLTFVATVQNRLIASTKGRVALPG